jgi:hypothetical protein
MSIEQISPPKRPRPNANMSDAIQYTKENIGVLPTLVNFLVGFVLALFKKGPQVK